LRKIDKQDYQRRLDRLGEVMRGIVDHATELSRSRCPYRDREDLCTAVFSCRNQIAPADPAMPAACGHDGTFDYRSAWESSPTAYATAKARIGRDRAEAARRRAARAKGTPPE
jgi:hypothetical protein